MRDMKIKLRKILTNNELAEQIENGSMCRCFTVMKMELT